jgi:DNA polymerase-3 subunit gamma/tau
MARKKAAEPVTAAPEAVAASEYTVLARRYRPQTFGDLVGQEAVGQALANAIKSSRVAHAYLFTGARGVGKTSTARILAKCLNCAQGPTIEPCGTCELCRAIASGEDVDVLEIDAASNRGIDEIRDLRSNVQYRPQRARYKIYIIDEVHMLTREAFNALLKTLEEPPPHVKFIFATTEVTKIPITILSRCQRFDFAGIGLKQLGDRLRQIVATEGMQADEEAIELIARRAGGSMRDAQSLLDQLLAFGGEKLTVDRVHQLLGTAHEERVAAIAAAVLALDARQALALVADAADRGLQLGELVDQLVEYWRDLMVVQAAGGEGQALSVTGQNKAALEAQAATVSPDTILAGLDVLVTAKNRLRTTTHARTVLEMALVRLARLDDLVPVTQLVQWLQDGGAVATGSARPAVGAARSDLEKKKLAYDPGPAEGPLPLTNDSLPVVWRRLIDQTEAMTVKHLLAASPEQAITGPNALVVRFPRGYNLPDETRRGQIEDLLAAVTGEKWRIKVEATAALAAGSERAELPESPMQRRRRQQDEILRLPVPARLRELLGAQLVDMEEGFGQAAPARPDDAPPATSDDELVPDPVPEPEEV